MLSFFPTFPMPSSRGPTTWWMILFPTCAIATTTALFFIMPRGLFDFWKKRFLWAADWRCWFSTTLGPAKNVDEDERRAAVGPSVEEDTVVPRNSPQDEDECAPSVRDGAARSAPPAQSSSSSSSTVDPSGSAATVFPKNGAIVKIIGLQSNPVYNHLLATVIREPDGEEGVPPPCHGDTATSGERRRYGVRLDVPPSTTSSIPKGKELLVRPSNFVVLHDGDPETPYSTQLFTHIMELSGSAFSARDYRGSLFYAEKLFDVAVAAVERSGAATPSNEEMRQTLSDHIEQSAAPALEGAPSKGSLFLGTAHRLMGVAKDKLHLLDSRTSGVQPFRESGVNTDCEQQ